MKDQIRRTTGNMTYLYEDSFIKKSIKSQTKQAIYKAGVQAWEKACNFRNRTKKGEI